MTSEACLKTKQLARGLQSRRSADNCLASCLCNVASFQLSIFTAFWAFPQNFSLHVLLNKTVIDISNKKVLSNKGQNQKVMMSRNVAIRR